MHDLVMRGGLVVDGMGSALRPAEVAVDGGVIRPFEEGVANGELPGKLVHGPQAAPTLLAAEQASSPPPPR